MFTPKTYSNGAGALTTTDMNRLENEIRNAQTQRGQEPLDSFAGANDDAKLAAAMSYCGSQTYKPTIVIGNRSHTFNNAITPYSGFRLLGSSGTRANEFRSTNKVKTPAGGWLTVSSNKDYNITGVSFEGTSNGAFLVPTDQSGSGGVWTDLNITNCGFSLYGPTFFSGAFTRANCQYWYVNSGTNTQIKLGGSDCAWWTDGVSFMSSAGNTQDVPLLDTGGLANSRLGKLYQTPQGGYGVRIQNGRMGLVFDNFTMTDWGRTDPNLMTMRAGIRIEGGEGVVFNNPIIFAVNANKVDPGDIMVVGGSQHVFNAPIFAKTYNGYTSPNLANGEQTPAIYTTVPIRVTNPISVGGRPKILQQASAGLILCNDPSWTIVTAA